MERRKRLGFLEAALALSLMVHLVVVLALYVVQKPEESAQPEHAINVDRLVIDSNKMQRYREKRVTTARNAPPPPARPQVSLQPVPMARPPLPPPVKPVVHDVTPPPVTRAQPSPEPLSSPSPSPEASPAPSPSPDVAPSPVPSPLVAAASPAPAGETREPEDETGDGPAGRDVPAAAAASPSPEPVAVTPSPSPSPSGGVNVQQDAKADFTLIVAYHNDDRLPRDKKGELTLDPVQISTLEKVKPVLLEVPRGAIPLRNAPQFGLKPMSRVRATVQVVLELPSGLPIPVQPSKVVVSDVTLDGVALEGESLARITAFIEKQVAASKWLLASDKGNWRAHSEEQFPVEVVQTADSVAEGSPAGAR